MKELLVWCGWCGCVMKLKKGSSHFLDNLSDCLIRAPEKILGGKKKKFRRMRQSLRLPIK